LYRRPSATGYIAKGLIVMTTSVFEQESWRKLWADVAQLLKKAGNAK
jgi:hypothetical protein